MHMSWNCPSWLPYNVLPPLKFDIYNDFNSSAHSTSCQINVIFIEMKACYKLSFKLGQVSVWNVMCAQGEKCIIIKGGLPRLPTWIFILGVGTPWKLFKMPFKGSKHI